MAKTRYLFGENLHDFVSERLYAASVDLSEARETRRTLGDMRPSEGGDRAEYEEAVATSHRLRQSIYQSLDEL